ncbi:hypothetical protein B0H21DRAFT_823276 [Amylocystis lapponica]|nr:hypothetical protein B0H21DRAFT_823276 [Amylocystis lapponica]
MAPQRTVYPVPQPSLPPSTVGVQVGVACIVCHKVLARKADMSRHMKLHSEDVETLKLRCHYENCKYATLQLSNLNTHMNTHTGAKPYLCHDTFFDSNTGAIVQCSFRTSDPGSLTRHRKRMHGYVPRPRARVVAAPVKTEYVDLTVDDVFGHTYYYMPQEDDEDKAYGPYSAQSAQSSSAPLPSANSSTASLAPAQMKQMADEAGFRRMAGQSQSQYVPSSLSSAQRPMPTHGYPRPAPLTATSSCSSVASYASSSGSSVASYASAVSSASSASSYSGSSDSSLHNALGLQADVRSSHRPGNVPAPALVKMETPTGETYMTPEDAFMARMLAMQDPDWHYSNLHQNPMDVPSKTPNHRQHPVPGSYGHGDQLDMYDMSRLPAQAAQVLSLDYSHMASGSGSSGSSSPAGSHGSPTLGVPRSPRMPADAFYPCSMPSYTERL